MNIVDELDKIAVENPELLRDMIAEAAEELGLDSLTKKDDKLKGGVLETRCPHCGKDIYSSS
jgi:hypothetical protein